MDRLTRDIDDLRERLRAEIDPHVRRELLRQMLDEEYKIGFRRELIDFFDREIDGWKDWISRQRSLVERLDNHGRECRLAKRLLELAHETLAIHELHRRRIQRILGLKQDSH
jgi:hypothetical protein